MIKGRCVEQVLVTIRFSKTDQCGKSTTLLITESNSKGTCPVYTLKAFLAMRSPGNGALFWHFDKAPLTRYQFSAIIKKSLLAQNISTEGITSHSFRIGACTHFAMAGVNDEELTRSPREILPDGV